MVHRCGSASSAPLRPRGVFDVRPDTFDDDFVICLLQTVYSRIARVCKHDRGGPHKFRYRWTSFLKARLNCSVAGDYPFYFNEIRKSIDPAGAGGCFPPVQLRSCESMAFIHWVVATVAESMAGPYESRHNGKRVDVMYATFTTPANAISGSAVCAFRLHDVERVFDGAFKEQAALNANWLPVAGHKVFFHSIPHHSGPAAARTLPSIDPVRPGSACFSVTFS